MEEKQEEKGILTRIAEAVWGLFVCFSYPLIAFIFGQIPAIEVLDSTSRRLIFSGIWLVLAAATGLIFYFAKGVKPLLSFRILEIRDKKQAWLLPLGGIIAFIGGVALNRLINAARSLISFPASWEKAYNDTMEGTVQGNAVVAFIAVCIAAPLIEELCFRGRAFYCFRSAVGKKAGVPVAVAVTSLLFASLHGNPIQFIYALICGLLFSLLTFSCGSVIPSILAHIGFNSANLIFLAFLNNPNVENMQLMVNIAAIIVFAICVTATVVIGGILRPSPEKTDKGPQDVYIR